MRLMVFMKYLTLLTALGLAVTSCGQENGQDLESRTAFVGRAFYSDLEQAGYADPTTFTINRNSLTAGETLALSVKEDYVYK